MEITTKDVYNIRVAECQAEWRRHKDDAKSCTLWVRLASVRCWGARLEMVLRRGLQGRKERVRCCPALRAARTRVVW